jgi:hypothetical protein
MKKQNQFHAILLASLALIGVSLATPSASADQEGTKPYKGIQIQLERDDTLGTDYWDDPFLVVAREIATGYYYGDSEIWSEGRDNTGGKYTSVGHQILYFTSATTADWYIWTEITSANGDVGWSSAVGTVDFVTNTVSGTGESYAENDPTSDNTGSGVIEGANSGDRLNVTEITGRIATVGSGKR